MPNYYDTADATWVTWVSSATSTTSTTYADNVWYQWVGSSTGTSSSITITVSDNVWSTWQDMPQPNGRCPLSGHIRPEGIDPAFVYDWSERDWVAREVYNERQIAREAAANAKREAEQRERAAAEAKADELLLSLLDAPARERYLAEGVVEVRVESGRLYELRKGWAGNVAELDPHTRKRTRRFCIHPRQSMPVADNLVAQMLMLQSDEDEFHRIANASVLA